MTRGPSRWPPNASLHSCDKPMCAKNFAMAKRRRATFSVRCRTRWRRRAMRSCIFHSTFRQLVLAVMHVNLRYNMACSWNGPVDIVSGPAPLHVVAAGGGAVDHVRRGGLPPGSVMNGRMHEADRQGGGTRAIETRPRLARKRRGRQSPAMHGCQITAAARRPPPAAMRRRASPPPPHDVAATQ